MDLPVMPPIKPMLAKAVPEMPVGDLLYEPKWDGFRCIIYRDGSEVELASRNERPLTRYFPELIAPLMAALPERCVVDGELVIPSSRGLDFDLLSQRIHPAESRVNLLSERTPASFVAFDILALDTLDLRSLPFAERRGTLESLLRVDGASVHVTPATREVQIAQDWFNRFEGSGFDGIIAKPLDGTYVSDKRVQFKLKHHRTADCVVAGYREHKDGGIGSLLLGLYGPTSGGSPGLGGGVGGVADDGSAGLASVGGGTSLGDGRSGEVNGLHHVGVCSGFAASKRRTLGGELSTYLLAEGEHHPWADWGDADAHAEGIRLPGAPSRWSGGNASEWTPLRIELVAEVTYENFTNGRFRHPARFVRWRPDKTPAECTYDQVDIPPPIEFEQIFR
ncbi:MAG: ATP-dependent DNA ligase [Microthrixaceae bacterium]